MSVKYRKWRLRGFCNSETPEQIFEKLGISNYVAHPTLHAKFGYSRFKGGVAVHTRNLPLGVYFLLSLFLAHGYRSAS